MPELPEVESYRLLAEKTALGRPVAAVVRVDPRYLRTGPAAALGKAALGQAVVGRRFVAARRTGKLMLLDTDGGPTLGLHFGMTGTLVVDGRAGVDWLLYSSRKEEPRFEPFILRFADGGTLAVRDPRRLGRVDLDPDESRLGIDLLALTCSALRSVLDASRAPLKARLLDQSRLAGLGNLMADEALWRAGLDPARRSGSLTPPEVRRLHRHLLRTASDLLARGGSHTGDLVPARRPGGCCPRDGAGLVSRRVGGRTTWSCPRHQR